jgi:hypothetical protein
MSRKLNKEITKKDVEFNLGKFYGMATRMQMEKSVHHVP